MKKISFFGKIKSWIRAHKILAVIILIIIIIIAYYIYAQASAARAVPQYVVAPVRAGSIVQTVTGSGQVSSEHQLDVTSEASGKIQAIHVSVGQRVKKDDLLATLDSRDALLTLENARIAYAKFVQPPKETDIQEARDSLTKSYSDGFNSVSAFFLDLPDIMAGLEDMFHDRDGFLSNEHAIGISAASAQHMTTAEARYDIAQKQYTDVLKEYRAATRTSTTSRIDALIENTHDLARITAEALKSAQNAVTFISANDKNYMTDQASSALTSVNTWSTTVNSGLTSLLSARNAIRAADTALADLLEGPDDLDAQSERLALQQAEIAYSKYFVRSPFDGIIGRIPVSIYDQVGASSVVATVIGDRKVANISLNEVDAARVKAGQPVSITFDAIDGLHATGTVDRVDLVGTVTQGVVSYTIKIVIDTPDDRIKPGMSMNISITTRKKDGVLIVPSSAVKTQIGRKYVEVLDAEMPIPNASSTRRMNAGSVNSGTLPQSSLTVTSDILPRQVTITIGEVDDTNTEIVSGLEQGQFVVTRTIAAGSATTQAPNILSSIGNRGGGGATRAVVR